jgi:ribose/xylose/arabinose/galactoside ABC-type transport system permease subunit
MHENARVPEPPRFNLQEPHTPAANPVRGFVITQLRKRNVQRIIANISLIVIIGTYVHVVTGLFWSVSNWESISIQIAVVSMMAVAMTLVMIAGYIDVSMPGVAVLSACVAGLLITNGLPVWMAFVVAVLVGGAVGLLNAVLVLGLRITSLIATIGTFYAAQGLANIVTNGLPVGGMPDSFLFVGQGSLGGIPVTVPMVLLVVALFASVQSYTLFGRWVVATGSNPRAAFLNGVNTTRTTVKCFVLSGAVAGWGGVVYASRLGVPLPSVDQSLLFAVIVAIVVGGTSLLGGEGSVLGTFTGALLIGTLNNGLNLLGISTFYYYIALGVLLVASVGFDTVLRRESVYRLRRWVLRPMRPTYVDDS